MKIQANKRSAIGGILLPKTLTFQQAPAYCGLSGGSLRNYEKAGLLTVYNVIIPGSTKGRKLIDRQSLDDLIEGSLGTVTTADTCKRGWNKREVKP